jgi:hypothetical protein
MGVNLSRSSLMDLGPSFPMFPVQRAENKCYYDDSIYLNILGSGRVSLLKRQMCMGACKYLSLCQKILQFG